MSTKMTVEERESFLQGLHVGVVSIAEEGRGPLTVPVWYDYEPGGVLWFITERTSRKGRLLAAAGRFSLCVQDEAPPYKYVSVEGPILSMTPSDLERDLRPMARRYLGEKGGDAYVDQSADQVGESVVVRMRPDRWLTVDYSKLGG